MLSQFFGNEIIKKIVKSSSTIVTLQAGSFLKLGGLGSQLKNNLTLNTAVSGIGGMESPIAINTFYYVYVVVSGVTEYLIASTSDIKPLAFNSYRKVGAFIINRNSDILHSFSINESFSSDWESFNSIVDSLGSGVGVATPVFKIVEGMARIKLRMDMSVSGTGSNSVFYHYGDIGDVDPAKLTVGQINGDTLGFASFSIAVNEPVTAVIYAGTEKVGVSDIAINQFLRGDDMLSGARLQIDMTIPMIGWPEKINWNHN